MSEYAPTPEQQHDPVIEGITELTDTVFGHDRVTRARTAVILLVALMYAICCCAAYFGGLHGLIKPIASTVLVGTAVPTYAVFYYLIRSGISKGFADPGLMIPQIGYALLAIAYAYTAMTPQDRGLVLVLLALVMVFGMYTHKPKHTVVAGLAGMLLIGASMGLLSQLDPVYYPPDLELLRFELLAGSVPALIFSGYQISAWRNRLAAQRRELKATLEQVERMAAVDQLTGLYNRRHMQDKLEVTVQRCERYGEGFTVVLLDMDHFKRINDQHGHRIGDEALTGFALAANMVLRETDTLSRWGGEEFLILLPNTTEDKAGVAVERLRRRLVDMPICASMPDLRIQFSAGVQAHSRADSLSKTLERADQALYQAKANGRNQTVVASALPDAADDRG